MMGSDIDDAPKAVEDGGEYYSIPEEMIEFLPEEWRAQLTAIVADGRAILKSVDDDLSNLSRLTGAYVTLVSLRHIRTRLSEHGFAADMTHLLELDMLTLAFVVTYARLHEGLGGSGFARSKLPAHLRGVHDQIIELRHQRFAHDASHHTVSNALEIQSDTDGGWFAVRLGYSFQVQVGGDPAWGELVDALDEIYASRMEKLLARMTEKTGRAWSLESGQPLDVEPMTSSRKQCEVRR